MTRAFVILIIVSVALVGMLLYIAAQRDAQIAHVEIKAKGQIAEDAKPQVGQGARGGVAPIEKPGEARKAPRPAPAAPKSTNLTPSYPSYGKVERWHCKGEYHPVHGTNFGDCKLVQQVSYESPGDGGGDAGAAGDAGASGSAGDAGGAGGGSGTGGAGAGTGAGAGAGCR